MIIRLTRTDDGTIVVTPATVTPEHVPDGVDPTAAVDAYTAAVDYGTAELEDIPRGSVFDGSWWHEHFVAVHFTDAEREAARAGDQA